MNGTLAVCLVPTETVKWTRKEQTGSTCTYYNYAFQSSPSSPEYSNWFPIGEVNDSIESHWPCLYYKANNYYFRWTRPAHILNINVRQPPTTTYSAYFASSVQFTTSWTDFFGVIVLPRNSFLGRCDCLGSTCAMSEPVQAASENRPKQWPIGIIECCRPIFSFSSTVHLNPWVDGFRVGWSSQVVFVGTNIGTTVQEVDGDNNDPVQDNYYWIPTCRDVLLLIPG